MSPPRLKPGSLDILSIFAIDVSRHSTEVKGKRGNHEVLGSDSRLGKLFFIHIYLIQICFRKTRKAAGIFEYIHIFSSLSRKHLVFFVTFEICVAGSTPIPPLLPRTCSDIECAK